MKPELVRRKFEDKLAQNEEVFRLLIESVREYAIFLLTPDGYVASWNAGAERLKGYKASDIIGRHFSTFYPAEVPREIIQNELQIALDEGQFRQEGWRVRKDGTTFWAYVTITPVRDATGAVRGFAKVTRDMTAARLAEHQREELAREQARRAEAERANQIKDAFLATLSHELRTPLNAIVGWAHLLDGHALDPEAKKAIEVIRRNAIAQKQLISDILDISRISAGKIHLKVARVDLDKVLQAAIDAVSPAAAAKGIRIVKTLSGPAVPISGDADRLQQIAWNLLANAVKFTPRGGRIDVGLERDVHVVRLSVRDDGEGIPAEFLPQVFEPFRQADSSPARAYGGLGLGLAIVRHLVEMHGGTMRAASPGVGKGSTFTIDLPATRAEPVSLDVPRPSENLPNLFGVKVLVVEDEPDSLQLVEAMLDGFGATVVTARSAAEGLQRLREHRPDVLVSDIEMAGTSGYDFMQQVRQLLPSEGGLVPAIALTAFAGPEDKMKALSTGFELHLPKPVLPLELATAIAEVTGRARSR